MKRLFAFILALTLSMVGCGGSNAADKADAKATTGGNMSANPIILIETTKGNIKIELDAAAAPKTVENILAYVNDGFYTGTIFHRVIPGFMVQGGGMTATMQEKADKRAPVQNEADNGLKNDRGTLAMARTSDPHSGSSQFFINVKNNDFLNFKAPTGSGWGYAVFGKVTGGKEVVDAIKKVKTGRKGFHDDVPVDAVVIEKAVLL